jgi:hypothetical protein
VRAVLLGAGLVTTVRVALNPELRRELFQSIARRLPIQELLDEIVLEADVVPDEADIDAESHTDAEFDTDAESDTDAEAEAEDDEEDAGEKKPAKPQARSQQSRRRVSRARGDTNGKGARKPPSRGTRA